MKLFLYELKKFRKNRSFIIITFLKSAAGPFVSQTQERREGGHSVVTYVSYDEPKPFKKRKWNRKVGQKRGEEKIRKISLIFQNGGQILFLMIFQSAIFDREKEQKLRNFLKYKKRDRNERCYMRIQKAYRQGMDLGQNSLKHR